MLSNLMDSADIGMIQCRCGAGFAQKALTGLPVVGDVIGQELEGDEAVQLGVLGLVDNTHAASAQSLQNPIM